MRIRGLGVLKMLFPAVLFVIALGGYAQTQAVVDDTVSASYRISVDVRLVALQAVVHDRQGRFVSDLSEQNFEVYEDGVRQSIRLFRHEDVPVTVGLVVDHGGSMRTKLIEVIAATRTFVKSSNPEDQMFVVNFNEKVPAAIRYTGSATELERTIWRAPAAGMTALYEAIFAGIQGVREGKRERKVLVVISDGGDNAQQKPISSRS